MVKMLLGKGTNLVLFLERKLRARLIFCTVLLGDVAVQRVLMCGRDDTRVWCRC